MRPGSTSGASSRAPPSWCPRCALRQRRNQHPGSGALGRAPFDRRCRSTRRGPLTACPPCTTSDPARSPRTAANSNDLGGRGQDTNRGRLATYSTRIAVADDGAEAAQPNGLQGAPSMGHRNGRSSLIVCWEPAPRGAMPGKRLLGLGVSRLDGAVRCCARRSGSRCRGRWFTPGYGTARPGQIWKRRHATGRVLDPACTSSASTACAC